MKSHDFNACTLTRYHLKLTQMELAKRLGINVLRVIRWERKAVLPTFVLYALIALRDENEKNPNPYRLEFKREIKERKNHDNPVQ